MKTSNTSQLADQPGSGDGATAEARVEALSAAELAIIEALGNEGNCSHAGAAQHSQQTEPHNEAALQEVHALEALALGLRTMERAVLPAGTTSRIMAQIPLRKPGARGKAMDWFHRHFGTDAWLPGRLIGYASGRCDFFFYWVAFMHLLMGVLLGLQLRGYEAYFPSIALRQPSMAFFLGAVVLCMGLLVRMRTKRHQLLARIGLFVYVALVVGNAFGLVTTFAASGMAMAAVAMVGGGLIIGSFLGTVLFTCTGGRRYE